MRQRKKFLPYFFLSLISLLLVSFVVYFHEPNSELIFFGFELPTTHFFLVFISLFFFSLSAYLFRNLRRGVFVGLLVFAFLLLRYFGLKHLIFSALLLLLFIPLELYFVKRK